MKNDLTTVEELRAEGLRLYYANALEEAVPLFDRALEIAQDAATRDLLTIHKASVHVALRRNSPEVQALPAIVMRRPEHRGLAAYHLATRFENEKEYGRARFYLDLALQAAEENGDFRLRVVTTIDLGNLCVYDSHPDAAIRYYESALSLLIAEECLTLVGEREAMLWTAFAKQNLGYCFLLTEKTAEGIDLLQKALSEFGACGGDAYAPESHIDLCLGFLELQRFAEARAHGEIGLETAREDRQIRNAHYLLGEVAYHEGDTPRAEHHFAELARWYPDFPQLSNLLFAIDLRKMVNFAL